MIVGRGIGWLLILLAAAVLAHDVWVWQGGEPLAGPPRAGAAEAGFHLTRVGEVWFFLDPDSLQLAQPAIERHLWPVLWDPVMIGILLMPASLLLAILGVLFLLLFRRRRRRLLAR
jgi:hypothetical protein